MRERRHPSTRERQHRLRPALSWLQATPHRECRVRVTVLPDSSSPDGGHKVKLAGVIVVEGLFQAYGEFYRRGDTAAWSRAGCGTRRWRLAWAEESSGMWCRPPSCGCVQAGGAARCGPRDVQHVRPLCCCCQPATRCNLLPWPLVMMCRRQRPGCHGQSGVRRGAATREEATGSLGRCRQGRPRRGVQLTSWKRRLAWGGMK